jgi:uncharacterized protein DUF6328
MPDEGKGEMAQRVETFLGEFRLMVPALGALLGFQLIVAFQQSYSELSTLDRAVNFAGVLSTTLALLFLVVPASYHRHTAELEETEDFLHYGQRSIGRAFVFIMLSLSFSLYLQAQRAFGDRVLSALFAVVLFALLAASWEWLPRRRARRHGDEVDRRGSIFALGGGHRGRGKRGAPKRGAG